MLRAHAHEFAQHMHMKIDVHTPIHACIELCGAAVGPNPMS